MLSTPHPLRIPSHSIHKITLTPRHLHPDLYSLLCETLTNRHSQQKLQRKAKREDAQLTNFAHHRVRLIHRAQSLEQKLQKCIAVFALKNDIESIFEQQIRNSGKPIDVDLRNRRGIEFSFEQKLLKDELLLRKERILLQKLARLRLCEFLHRSQAKSQRMRGRARSTRLHRTASLRSNATRRRSRSRRFDAFAAALPAISMAPR